MHVRIVRGRMDPVSPSSSSSAPRFLLSASSFPLPAGSVELGAGSGISPAPLPALTAEDLPWRQIDTPGGGPEGSPLSSVDSAQRDRLLSASEPLVLFIDDEVDAKDALIVLLEFGGFRVECVQTGADGLSLASGGAYEAVVLDLRLPDIPGLAVLEQLHATAPDLPVVVITGWFLDLGHEEAARRLGARDYLHKPQLDETDLATALRRAIHQRQARGTARVEETEQAEAPTGAPPAAVIPQPEAQGLDGISTWEHQLTTQLYARLRTRLRGSFPCAGDATMDAIQQALVDHLNRERRGRAPKDLLLENFLYQASWRNVRDTYRSDERRRTREDVYARETYLKIAPPDLQVTCALDARDLLLVHAQTEAERRAATLWLDEAPDEEIAAALGCSHLPPAEQRAEVKRFRERILKRIRRALGLL